MSSTHLGLRGTQVVIAYRAATSVVFSGSSQAPPRRPAARVLLVVRVPAEPGGGGVARPMVAW